MNAIPECACWRLVSTSAAATFLPLRFAQAPDEQSCAGVLPGTSAKVITAMFA